MNARAHFDRLYADSPDPWQVRSSTYEQRKIALVLAMLPRARYRWAFEPACGSGAMSERLAARCERVTAADFSAPAVASARAHLAPHRNVEVCQLDLPRQWLHTWPLDLVVMAEFLYYLPPDALDATLQCCRALRPSADLVSAHARADFGDRTLSAVALDRALRDAWGEPSARYEEPAYAIDVWAAPPGLPQPGAGA